MSLITRFSEVAQLREYDKIVNVARLLYNFIVELNFEA